MLLVLPGPGGELRQLPLLPPWAACGQAACAFTPPIETSPREGHHRQQQLKGSMSMFQQRAQRHQEFKTLLSPMATTPTVNFTAG